MKRLLLMLLLSGCSFLDMNGLTVPGVVDRSLQDNIWLSGVDSGKLTRTGLTVSDVNIVTYGHDLNALVRLRLAQANGASVGAAISQAALAATISGIAIGQGSLAAAGGLAAGGLFLGHIFGIVNSPGHAVAYQQLIERNLEAENEFWSSLAAETCGSNVSGSSMTVAGAMYLGRLNNSIILYDRAEQRLMPTIEQLQGATVPAASRSLRARDGCPPPQARVRSTVP